MGSDRVAYQLPEAPEGSIGREPATVVLVQWTPPGQPGCYVGTCHGDEVIADDYRYTTITEWEAT